MWCRVLYASIFQKNPHGTGARFNGDGVAVRSVFGLDGEDHREGDQRRPKEAAEAHERSREARDVTRQKAGEYTDASREAAQEARDRSRATAQTAADKARETASTHDTDRYVT